MNDLDITSNIIKITEFLKKKYGHNKNINLNYITEEIFTNDNNLENNYIPETHSALSVIHKSLNIILEILESLSSNIKNNFYVQFIITGDKMDMFIVNFLDSNTDSYGRYLTIAFRIAHISHSHNLQLFVPQDKRNMCSGINLQFFCLSISQIISKIFDLEKNNNIYDKEDLKRLQFVNIIDEL